MNVVAAQSKFLLSRYSAPRKLHILFVEKSGYSVRRSRWQVTTPPHFLSSNGASTHLSVCLGHETSSSAKTMILVLTSGIARAIWRRLLGLVTARQRSLLCCAAGILAMVLFASSKFAWIVTSISCLGWFCKIDSMVCSNSRPRPSSEGKMTVTSSEVKSGCSGGAMGRKQLNATRLMTYRA